MIDAIVSQRHARTKALRRHCDPSVLTEHGASAAPLQMTTPPPRDLISEGSGATPAGPLKGATSTGRPWLPSLNRGC